MDFSRSRVVDYIEKTLRVTRGLQSQVDVLIEAARAIVEAIRRGNKVLVCGNGGSAADAQHLAAELMGKFYHKRRMLPALALTTNPSILTAIANDFSFDEVFVRQVRGWVRPGDVLVGISTSGESRNVLLAVYEANRLGAVTVGLSGEAGKLKEVVEHALVVPSRETPLVQQAHGTAVHILCALVESAFYPPEGARAVFLDRDGVINRDVPCCSTPEDFQMYPDVPEALKLLRDAGLKLVVVTNQPGVRRGCLTLEALEAIHDKMREELAAQGVRLDAVYYCPHHPNDGCPCRKPEIGLFTTASEELHIELARSFVVGDSEADIEVGMRIGAQTVLARRSSGRVVPGTVDRVVPDLLAAAQWIAETVKAESMS